MTIHCNNCVYLNRVHAERLNPRRSYLSQCVQSGWLQESLGFQTHRRSGPGESIADVYSPCIVALFDCRPSDDDYIHGQPTHLLRSTLLTQDRLAIFIRSIQAILTKSNEYHRTCLTRHPPTTQALWLLVDHRESQQSQVDHHTREITAIRMYSLLHRLVGKRASKQTNHAREDLRLPLPRQSH